MDRRVDMLWTAPHGFFTSTRWSWPQEEQESSSWSWFMESFYKRSCGIISIPSGTKKVLTLPLMSLKSCGLSYTSKLEDFQWAEAGFWSGIWSVQLDGPNATCSSSFFFFFFSREQNEVFQEKTLSTLKELPFIVNFQCHHHHQTIAALETHHHHQARLPSSSRHHHQ